jgi:hypothetical protein
VSALSLGCAAAVSALLLLGGRALAGRGGAALAPALFWLVPRHLQLLLAAPRDLETSWLLVGGEGASGPGALALAALTVPAALAAVMAAGAVHSSWLLARALRDGDRLARRREMLLVAAGTVLLAASAWRGSPRALAPAAPALLVLSILGARALTAAGRALWPDRARAVTAALAVVALAPGLRAGVHAWPYGFASWNELAGGAPGAASRGLPRQVGGDSAAGILRALGEHAAAGARVWWQETPRADVEAWQRQGRLRADLRWADGPEDADLALWQFRADERDREFRIWSAFGTARPADGVFFDEVPLLLVYARPGAWR